MTIALCVVGAVLCLGAPALAIVTVLQVATAPGDPTFRSLMILFIGVPVLFVGCCWLIEVLAQARTRLRGGEAQDHEHVLRNAISWALVSGLITTLACVAWFAPRIFPGIL